MRNVYIFLILLICVTTVNAQFTANFTADDLYEDGLLNENNNWGGTSNWFVNVVSGAVSTQTDYAQAFWGQSINVNINSTSTFEVSLKLSGPLLGVNDRMLALIGFNPTGKTNGGADREFINLKYVGTNGKLKIQKKFGGNLTNVGYQNGFLFEPSAWKSQDIIVKVALTLGTTKDNTRISARMINPSQNISLDIGYYEGVSQAFYNAAISNGVAYGFFQSYALNDGDDGVEGSELENFAVSSVSLLTNDTLGFESKSPLMFSLLQNPVQNELGITGLDTGSQISIYSISGAKVHTQEFNGKSINVSNLNAGLYFLETPGYSVKKFLKK
jgi:hypothetical protein